MSNKKLMLGMLVSFFVFSGWVQAAQTAMEKIQVTDGDFTDRPYKVLGDLNVTASKITVFSDDPTRKDVDEELREAAFDLGADAVILVRYDTLDVTLFSWGEMDGKGKAVKFLDTGR